MAGDMPIQHHQSALKTEIRRRLESGETAIELSQELHVGRTTIYQWARSAGWEPDPPDVRGKRHSERLTTPGLDISTPRYCLTCNKLLELKRYGDGRWERPSHFAKRKHCDKECEANFGLPKYDRFCLTCHKLLERKQYDNGRLERPSQFTKRQHCDYDCAANDPDPERRLQRRAASEIAFQSPKRLERIRSPENKARAGEITRQRFAAGEQIPPAFIHKTRVDGEPYHGLTDSDILSILADCDSYTTIAQRYRISVAFVSNIKNGKTHKHVPRTNVILRKQGSSVGGENPKARAVETPKGYFDTVTLASIAYRISSSYRNPMGAKRPPRLAFCYFN